MSGSSNKLIQFWQELKRRRVIHVIIVYATAAYVIIELINNVTGPLNLPDWTPTLIIIILLVGFPLAIIFSWIFDVTPEGIEKTKPSKELQKHERTVIPNSWRIATYVSVAIILGLLAYNIFDGRKEVKIDESLAKSIAVLPFHNYSGDSGQDYICQGLTDEIISHLFKVASFDEVRSLTSVLKFKDSDLSTTEIAEDLEVNYILEGSYKKMGDKLRITAQLIEPRSDKHIWLKDYDLPYKEIMGIPSEIALQIADHLKAFLTGNEQQSIERIPTENLEAYELMQQAIYLFNKSFFKYSDSIIDLAEKALELDPNYADAYAWKGEGILMNGIMGWSDFNTLAWEAESLFDIALKIDPLNLMANWGMSMIDYFVKWDYVSFEEFYSQFYNLSKSDINLNLSADFFYTVMGRFEKALSYIDDTLSIRSIQDHILLGNIQHARDLNNENINLWGVSAYLWAGIHFVWMQEFDKGLYYLESGMGSEGVGSINLEMQAALAVAYYKTGNHIKAQKTVNQLIQRSDTTSSGSPAFFTGWYYGFIGELDSAFYWLEKAVRNLEGHVPWIKVMPAFNNLKDDPRYWDLYERTGHKAYDDYIANKNQ